MRSVLYCCAVIFIVIALVGDVVAFGIRAKRAIEDDEDDLLMCCGSGTKPNENYEKIEKQCDELTKDVAANITDEEIQFLQSAACSTECVGKQLFYDSNGAINKTAFLEYHIEQGFPPDDESKWEREVSESVYDECMEMATEAASNYTMIPCDMIALGMELCLWRTVETRCPKEKRKDTEICDEVREYLSENSNLYLL